MESILLIILIGLAGGVAVGLQSPMASMITQRLGIFESVFIVHVGGAILALILQATLIGWIPASMWAWRVSHKDSGKNKKIKEAKGG